LLGLSPHGLGAHPNVFLVASWAIFYAVWRWQRGEWDSARLLRDAIPIVLGVMTAVCWQISYNSLAYGRLTLSSYAGQEFLWNRPMFFSDRGLFNYYPSVALLLLVGFLAQQTRLATCGLVLLISFYALLYGFWWSWQLGCGFGHRGFIELMPFAMVLFALALHHVPKFMQRPTLAVSVVLVIITLQFMVGYWRGTLPMQGTNPEQYWAHVVGRHSLVRTLARVSSPFFSTSRPEARPGATLSQSGSADFLAVEVPAPRTS
jgi:hypothetical protein